MEHLIEFALFFAKVFTVVIGLIAIIIVIASVSQKGEPENNKLEVKSLNKRFQRYKNKLLSKLLDKKELKKESKKEKVKNKTQSEAKDRVFVIEFKGDMKASHVDYFKDEITSVLSVASANDECVILLESPGGMVHTYGLAASQMLRLKEKGLKLTVCVDKVAASGGYLMACTADKILAAPFAILGSVGVLAQVPNAHNLLKKYDIDYQEYTAGDYKRTISHFGEITEKGKEKFLEQLEETHSLFKDFVSKNRPIIDIQKIATGEHWYGTQALDLKLIDEIKTSDSYLLDASESKNIYQVKVSPKKSLKDKLASTAALGIEKSFMKLLEMGQYKF